MKIILLLTFILSAFSAHAVSLGDKVVFQVKGTFVVEWSRKISGFQGNMARTTGHTLYEDGKKTDDNYFWDLSWVEKDEKRFDECLSYAGAQYEEVTVPAGTFQTCAIIYQNEIYSNTIIKSYYAKEVPFGAVKREVVGGELSEELVSFIKK